MKKIMSLLILLSLPTQAATNPVRSMKVEGGYLMVLKQGENVLEKIEELAVKEKIPAATFTGMGFVNVKFGFFNFKTKKYEPKEFKSVELASLTGSIAWQKGKPSIHAHGVVAGKDFQAKAGHLLNAEVSTGSVEIRIFVMTQKLERIMDENLGANVLEIN